MQYIVLYAQLKFIEYKGELVFFLANKYTNLQYIQTNIVLHKYKYIISAS